MEFQSMYTDKITWAIIGAKSEIVLNEGSKTEAVRWRKERTGLNRAG